MIPHMWRVEGHSIVNFIYLVEASSELEAVVKVFVGERSRWLFQLFTIEKVEKLW